MIKRGFLLLAFGAALVGAPSQPTLTSQAAASQPSSAGALSAARQPAGAASPDDPSMTISLSATTIRPGEIVTVTASYGEFGPYYADLAFTPSEHIAVDPPSQMPCSRNSSPNQCRTFRLRGVSEGRVTIRGSAYGETYDESCRCFVWRSVSTPPQTLVVSGRLIQQFPPRVYLPTLLANE